MKRGTLLLLGWLLLIPFITVQSQTKASQKVVEVLYFHGKQRCVTCRSIEKLTQEVLAADFAKEVKSGRIKFKTIDISTSEGEALADTYQVSWSSLYLNLWKGQKETRNDMTAFAFKHAKSNPAAFKKGIKEKLTTLLR
ncbi:MAG: nitrophenyl compound nitroreductase subunit ArsF family protein [Bacteroides sp.]